MAGISTYLANALLDHSLRNSAFTQPAALYLALFTTAAGPGDAAGAASGAEVSTGGGSLYVRQAITFAAAASLAASNNGATIVFPAAGTAWGTIAYAGIFDASSSGHLLYYATLNVAKTVNIGDVIELLASQFVITYS